MRVFSDAAAIAAWAGAWPPVRSPLLRGRTRGNKPFIVCATCLLLPVYSTNHIFFLYSFYNVLHLLYVFHTYWPPDCTLPEKRSLIIILLFFLCGNSQIASSWLLGIWSRVSKYRESRTYQRRDRDRYKFLPEISRLFNLYVL